MNANRLIDVYINYFIKCFKEESWRGGLCFLHWKKLGYGRLGKCDWVVWTCIQHLFSGVAEVEVDLLINYYQTNVIQDVLHINNEDVHK